MGFFRNRRKRKLKQELLRQGRLDTYTKRFDIRIKELEKTLQKYVDMALDGKRENDEQKMVLGIKYTKYIEGNLAKMRNLKGSLEAARLGVDSQAAYNELVQAVAEFTGELKENRVSKWFQRRVLRRHKRATGTLASQLRMIDDRLEKIDDNMGKVFEDRTDYADVDVQSFLDKYDS